MYEAKSFPSFFSAKTGMLESQRFPPVEIPASSSAWQVSGGGGWWEGSHRRTGRSATCHTPTESICDLALALCTPPRAGRGLQLVGCVCAFFFACVSFACVQTSTTFTPCHCLVGRTALIGMPSGYVADGRVSISFAMRRAHAPLGSWSTWSPHFTHSLTHLRFSSLFPLFSTRTTIKSGQ
jgi:hypothetical protein